MIVKREIRADPSMTGEGEFAYLFTVRRTQRGDIFHVRMNSQATTP